MPSQSTCTCSFCPFERYRSAAEHFPIEPHQQHHEPPLFRSREHQHTAADGWGKLGVVQIIAIEGDERPPELPRQTIVLAVAGATEIVMFHDEQDIPTQIRPHERDEPRRHVGIDVHARLIGQPLDVRRELREKSAHVGSPMSFQIGHLDGLGGCAFARGVRGIAAQRCHQFVAFVEQSLALPFRWR